MKRQLGISKIDLAVRELDIDLDNFTNARFYRIKRTVKILKFSGKDYFILEIDDENLGHPGSDILMVVANLQGGSCLRHVIWDDMVWVVVDDLIINTLSKLAGLNIEGLKNTAKWLRNDSQRHRLDESGEQAAARRPTSTDNCL